MVRIMQEKVYEIVKQIPYGKVATYSQIAEKLGNKKLARVVGNILHNNPDEKNIFCYKIVNSKGYLAKNYAFGGIEKQKRRLESENIEVVNNKVDLKIYLWENDKLV